MCHVVSCSRVSKQQARSTHISVTVYLSQVSSPSLWWGDILGIRWNLARSKISVACRLLQATPPPQGERGCSCSLFPSRPKWSLGQQALQTGRPKLGLGGGRGMRGKWVPLNPPSSLASCRMKMQLVPASLLTKYYYSTVSTNLSNILAFI